ncbi:DUF445 family protein [Fictibacillus sp. Mic-4]|uniref:DUF445 domain-containing protein n=1 Tax=Fictibacillus sp. Mic-4 TaxID=3132826 RepID=UPI003CF0C551
MNSWLTIIFMIVIGAVIGGVTNLIAIKMLFRPYNTLYIGKFRVPFTPGLIPKRKSQLAVQLGETVMKHLLTAEGVQSKVNDPVFKDELKTWIGKEIDRFLTSDITIQHILQTKFHIQNAEETIKEKAGLYLEKELSSCLTSVKEQSVEEFLPKRIQEKIEAKLPELTNMLFEKGIDYLESYEGKRMLEDGINTFLKDKGMLLNMVSMFFESSTLVDKIRPEFVKLLRRDETKQMLEQILLKEWQAIKKTKLENLDEHLELEKIAEPIKDALLSRLPIQELFYTPLKDLTKNYREGISERFVPQSIELATQLINNHLEVIFEKLQLARIIEEQVEAFSLQRLEEIIISIANSELKMITFLGALLGGVIGFVQGVIVIFL